MQKILLDYLKKTGGFLDQDDLKYGLGKLNIYPNELNLKLFMKRYDTYK